MDLGLGNGDRSIFRFYTKEDHVQTCPTFAGACEHPIDCLVEDGGCLGGTCMEGVNLGAACDEHADCLVEGNECSGGTCVGGINVGAACEVHADCHVEGDECGSDLTRINRFVRGSAPAGGPPGPPEQVTIEYRASGPFGAFFGPPTDSLPTITLAWAANQESDLAGYHVEMRDGVGAWQRLTDHPLAYWETTFDYKAYLRDPACFEFRVIAIDQEGNESTPVEGLDGSSCGPALEAPQNLRVSTGSINGNVCTEVLEWDTVPGAARYNVYRFPFNNSSAVENWHASYRFYLTQEVLASDTTRCDTETCAHEEDGSDLKQDPVTNINTHCPWPWQNPNACAVYTLDAYYVTAVGPDGSESAKSDVVFWDCSQSPEYDARLRADREPTAAIASNATGGAEVEDAVCEEPLAESMLAQSLPAGACSDPHRALSVAPLLTLGTADPPYVILDLHVDHLGSVRLITNDAGQVHTTHDFFPFGKEYNRVADPYNSKLFTGHERDKETGLDYMLARYYSSSLSRFLSSDPGNKARGNLRVPQRWNLYTYARNNPLAFIDPDGREEIAVTITTRITTPTTTFMGATFLGDAGGNTFRTRQTVKIETDPAKGGALKSATGEVGRTVMLSPVLAASEPNRQPTTMEAGASRDANGTTTMTASGNESNPLVPGSPGITYSFSFAVGSDGSTKLTGAHDGFPGYTVEVTREDGTTETIYEHDPEETGEGPGSLIPPAETEVNETGKLPEKKEPGK